MTPPRSEQIKTIRLSHQIDERRFAGSKLLKCVIAGNEIDATAWNGFQTKVENHLREKGLLSAENRPRKHRRQGGEYSVKGVKKLLQAAKIPLSECLIEIEDVKDRFKKEKKGEDVSMEKDINAKTPAAANPNTVLNKIYYGPPGTGKTYFLKNELFKNFMDRETTLTDDEFSENVVEGLTWWETIAMAMIEIKEAKVATILDHPIIGAKTRLAHSQNLRATIWGVLQAHTKRDCKNVGYKLRSEPTLFWKDEASVWSIDMELVAELVPDLIEKLEKWKEGPTETVEKSRFIFTTFHQSYSYEDFVEGIRPVIATELEGAEGEIKYEIRQGVFKEIAAKAQLHPDKDYAIFIDEINRGNIANIFGELITLIEEDKRQGAKNEMSARLPYSREEFGVPKNLHIIGTMNTADRSVEALDTALRRRFTFIEMMPDPNLLENHPDLLVDLPRMLKTINSRIERLLDRDHTIGHAYLMHIATSDDPLNALQLTFKNKIIPLLQEYFYGDPGKISMVLSPDFVHPRGVDVEFGTTDYDEFEVGTAYDFEDPLKLSVDAFCSIYE